MSIMEIKQVGYSYDNKKKVLKGVNAERFTSMGRILPRRGFPTTGKTMWRLSSRRTT